MTSVLQGTALVTLTPATASQLGGVIAGAGLQIDGNGVLSVAPDTTPKKDVLPVEVITLPKPTANNQTFNVALTVDSAFYVLLPYASTSGYFVNYNIEIDFPTATEDGVSFEIFDAAGACNPSYTYVAANGSILDSASALTPFRKYRWSQEQSTWYQVG